ncbi:MAG: ABC transporter permease, partial [Rhodospirillaceae bacterium]|nr:ABC transporter permease [Rhodospirillaceae bacterium]
NDGYGFIRNTPWLVVAGGIPLILTTLGFTFLGESLRDVFDPKLKRDR